MKNRLSILLFWLCFSMATQAATVTVEQVSVSNRDDTIIVQAEFNIADLEVIDEAIDSGVMLAIIAKLNCYQTHNLWFDRETFNDRQTLQLRYFSLIQQYQLKNIEQNRQHNFISLTDMWQYIAQQLTFEVSKQQLKNADYCTLKLRMDSGALPSAMQLPVMLSNDWEFNSGSHLFKLPEASPKP